MHVCLGPLNVRREAGRERKRRGEREGERERERERERENEEKTEYTYKLTIQFYSEEDITGFLAAAVCVASRER